MGASWGCGPGGPGASEAGAGNVGAAARPRSVFGVSPNVGLLNLFFLPTIFGGSVAFLAASAARSASIWAFDRLGLRVRPSRLNRAQWFSIASVRFGFLELAILSRRACSAGSKALSGCPSAAMMMAAGEARACAPLGAGSSGASWDVAVRACSNPDVGAAPSRPGTRADARAGPAAASD